MSQALNVIAEVLVPGRAATNLDWADVRYPDAMRIRAALAARYSPSTANKALAAFRGVLKSAFRLGLIDAEHLARTGDVQRIRGDRIPKGRSLDGHDVCRLIAACDTASFRGARNAAVVAIGYGCGLRRAELAALETGDILDGGQAIRVRGKGNKERIAYLPDGVRTYLSAWLKRRGDQAGALFVRKYPNVSKVNGLTDQTVYDVIRALAKKAALGRVSPHDLRRTFVSTLLDRGVDLSTASAMCGHAHVATTARYDRRGENAKMKAAKALDVSFAM